MRTDSGLLLADQGRTEWQIVTGYPAAPAECHAAQELQTCLQEITGACFPIQDDRTPAGSYEILIGNNRRLPDLSITPTRFKLGDDGFIIQTGVHYLAIAGGSPRGTLYGVYSFLETYLSCRWFTPTVSRIPRLSRLEIADIQDVQVPVLQYRDAFVFEGFDPDWSVRNKINGHTRELTDRHGGKISYSHFVHTFDELVPVREYFDSHPEYFSEREGRRLRSRTQLCLTNPAVLNLVIQKVRLWLQQNPHAQIVSVSQNDCYNPCLCENCKTVDDYEGGHSGTLIRFVNQVAQAIATDFPSVAIDTLAYQYTRKAPRHVRPAGNVIVRLCSIECCFSHPLETCQVVGEPFQSLESSDTVFAEDLQAWSRICDRLYIWDYVTDFAHYLMPFPNIKVLGPNIRFFVAHQVKGIFEQGNYQSAGGDFSELKAYLLAKLLWDPQIDADAVMVDFLKGVYGRAAAPMLDYINLLHNKVQVENIHLGIFDSPAKGHLTAEVLDQADRLFDRAEKLAENDQILRQVKKARIPLVYARLYHLPEDSHDLKDRLSAFYAALTASGVTAVSEFLSVDECRHLTDQGLTPREIETQLFAKLNQPSEA